MAASATTIRVSGLRKNHVAALQRQAKAQGLSADVYARRLIEAGLALEQRARKTSFSELFGGVRAQFRRSGLTEAELDSMVDVARTRHHRRSSRKKKN